MSLDTVKALMIINAKKGWTAEARAKAAATRKAKKKPVVKQKITTKLPEGVKVKHNSKGKAHYEYKGGTATTLSELKKLIKRRAQPVEPDTRSLYERRMDQFNS